MESLIDAGIHMGFNRDTSTMLVKQMLLGSAKLSVEEMNKHPVSLRNEITSPAGTSADAI